MWRLDQSCDGKFGPEQAFRLSRGVLSRPNQSLVTFVVPIKPMCISLLHDWFLYADGQVKAGFGKDKKEA